MVTDTYLREDEAGIVMVIRGVHGDYYVIFRAERFPLTDGRVSVHDIVDKWTRNHLVF